MEAYLNPVKGGGAVKRILTGIPGLDRVLRGGYPANSIIVMHSDPNDYIESILQQYAYRGLRDGNPVVYCNITRSPQAVVKSMAIQGMDPQTYIEKGMMVFVDMYSLVDVDVKNEEEIPEINEGIVRIKNIDSPETVQMAISAGLGTLNSMENIRLVVESPGEILNELDNIRAMRFWKKIHLNISRYDINILLAFLEGLGDDLFRVLSHHADGVIEIRTMGDMTNPKTLFMVKKMRYTPIRENRQFLVIFEESKVNILDRNIIK